MQFLQVVKKEMESAHHGALKQKELPMTEIKNNYYTIMQFLKFMTNL